MKIANKLTLQKELGGLLLFREGLFLKAYNESCYVLTQLLGQDLKVKCYRVKNLKGQYIVECAFQYSKLTTRLPQAVETAFGVRVEGEFDLPGYAQWYERRCRAESEAQSAAKAETRPLQTVSASASSPAGATVSKTSVLLPLTAQQLAYLQNWQKGIYPIEVDLGFIESLKQQLNAIAFQYRVTYR